MLLEQITTDYEDDDDQQPRRIKSGPVMSYSEAKELAESFKKPQSNGMGRTEMGRLVKKADQDAWEKKSAAAMQAQLKSRGASSLKEKKVGYALKAMKKKK